jgi:hypothetical protein
VSDEGAIRVNWDDSPISEPKTCCLVLGCECVLEPPPKPMAREESSRLALQAIKAAEADPHGIETSPLTLRLLVELEEAWKRALEWKAVGWQMRQRAAKLAFLEQTANWVRLYGADRSALEDLRGQLEGVQALLLSWGIRNK